MKKHINDAKNCSEERQPAEDRDEGNLVPEATEALHCVAGKCAFWITWDGRMTPCSLMDRPNAFPFKNGFTNAWRDIQKLCSSLSLCMECQHCDHREECMPCPARLKLETGFYDKPAPYLCELVKYQYTEKEVIKR